MSQRPLSEAAASSPHSVPSTVPPENNDPCPSCGQPLPPNGAPPVPVAPIISERRRVAVLFADLQGFTAICEKSDAEDVIDLLNTIYDRLLPVAYASGAYLDKILGDGLMLLFGAPRSREDDALRAVKAAIAMQKVMPEMEKLTHGRVGADVKLRIGVSYGEVVWGTVGPAREARPTVIGDVANTAARLQHVAPPGGIVVVPEVYERTKRWIQYRAHDPVSLHGKADPLPYYEVFGLSSRVTIRETGAQLHLPFVNRAQEMNLLNQLWKQAILGKPQVIVISGESGIGKSRLVAEFLRSVRDAGLEHEARILEASANRYRNASYSPVVALLRAGLGVKEKEHHAASRIKIRRRLQRLNLAADDMMPVLGYLFGWAAHDPRLRHVHPQSLRQRAFSEATMILIAQARDAPTLLFADDWQDASPDSLEMIAELVNELIPFLEGKKGPLSMLLVLAARPGSPLEHLRRPKTSFHTLPLKPLSQQAGMELAQALVDPGFVGEELITTLALKSGGNPFYLVEGARSLTSLSKKYAAEGEEKLGLALAEAMIPDSIHGLVSARIDSLSDDARTTVQYAAVIGLRFRYALLTALHPPCRSLDASLAELVSRGLVREVTGAGDEPVYRFVYDVVREVAYGMLLRKTRQQLHEEVAKLTEASEEAVAFDEVQNLAHHYLAGGNLSKSIVYATQAGMMALAHSAYRDARTYLEQALELLQQNQASDAERIRVQEALADSCTFSGQIERAVQLYQGCLEMGGASGQKHLLHYKLGRAYYFEADPLQAYAHYAKALSLLPAGEDSNWAARIEADIAVMFDRV